MQSPLPLITIGRQLGSQGSVVGRTLASALRIPFYDKELITQVAQESGLDARLFAQVDERPGRGLTNLFIGNQNIVAQVQVGHPHGGLSSEHLFQIQSDVIRQIAQAGPCVIMGRCADFILRDQARLLTVFLSANEDDRLRTVMDRDRLSLSAAASLIRKADKRRTAYYDYFTNKPWGRAASYHLCLNTSLWGVEGCVDLIRRAIAARWPEIAV